MEIAPIETAAGRLCGAGISISLIRTVLRSNDLLQSGTSRWGVFYIWGQVIPASARSIREAATEPMGRSTAEVSRLH